jgi:putative drug exporter of the RND superfamily
MGSVLHAVGAFSARRHWLVIAIWAIVLAGVVGTAGAIHKPTDDSFSIPGTASVQTFEKLGQVFPASGGTAGDIVIAAPAGASVTDPAYAAAISQAATAVGALPHVAAAADPFVSKAIAPDTAVAYIKVNYDVPFDQLPPTALADAQAASRVMETAGLRVEFAGTAYIAKSAPGGGSGEALGAIVAVIVLLITLRTIIGAVLPFVTGIAAVGLGVGGVYALTSVTAVTSTAPVLALMLGLAVGIDYSLFILSRHRSQLLAGMGVRESIARANGTAGAAVVFAGATVVVALLALFVAHIPFLTIMGNAAALTVALAVVAALTLLPAILSLVGLRVLPRKTRAAVAAASADAPVEAEPTTHPWARFVTKRPILVGAAAVALLVVLAIPAASLRLGLPSERSQPADSSARQAYDLLEQHFGAGFNGPIVLLAETTNAATGAADAATTAKEVSTLANVAFVSPAIPSADGAAYLIQVIPTGDPDSAQTEQLVHDIRALAPVGDLTLGVTGETAIKIDVAQGIADALPGYLAIVVGLALVLLLLVFRSILIPIKALVGFLLTLSATTGAVVAVFQWGWLAHLLGVTYAGPIVAFLPIIGIGITFGLAMDYEVFLVSRMREEHLNGRTPVEAIVVGFSHSSRVVTAAALIMTSVFAGFMLDNDVVIKAVGFALAFAVLIDAFVVRMTLVPAIMTLLGRAAWWLPNWLQRVVPEIHLEGDPDDAPALERAV